MENAQTNALTSPTKYTRGFKANASGLCTIALPALAIALLIVLPAVVAVYMSIHGGRVWDLSHGWDFSGYRALLSDPLFYSSLQLSVEYMLWTVSLQLLIGTFAAIVVHAMRLSSRQLAILTIIIFLPYAVPSLVAVHLWFFLVNDQGFLALSAQRLFGVPPTSWMGSRIFSTLVIVSVWQFYPFVYVTILAVLRRIPPALYRSAQVDGAHPWHQFRFVTFRGIRRALLVVLLLRFAFMFTKFDTPWLLGARTATDKLNTLPIYIYERLPTLDSEPAGSVGLAGAVVLAILLLGAMYLGKYAFSLIGRRFAGSVSLSLFPKTWLPSIRYGSTKELRAIDAAVPRRLPYKLMLLAGLLLVLFFSVLPYGFLISASFLPNSDVDRGVSRLIRNDWTLDNYRELVVDWKLYVHYLGNTIAVSGATTVGVLILSVMGAFGFTRYKFRGRRLFEQAALWGYALPPIVLLFSWMRLLDFVHQYNTLSGLVIANIAFCLPFSLWLMIQYFKDVSLDTDKAVAADGAPWWHALRIICRQTRPGIAAVSMFVFILSWNDVVLSLKLVTDADKKTLAVGIQQSILEVEASRYGTFAAASIGLVTFAILVFGWIQFRVDSRLRKELEQDK